MDIEFNKNEDKMNLLISAMEKKLEKIYLGGGKTRIDKLHEQGKMTARERIEYLIDKDSKTIEIGAFTGEDMYKEHGGCPAGGVVIVIGYISGRQCIIVANDATVKAGAWFPITGKKNLRAQEIAMENRLPIPAEGTAVTELLYRKRGGEHFMVAFDMDHTDAVLMQLGAMAADRDLNFTWYDAAVLSQRIRTLQEAHERDPAGVTGMNSIDLRRTMYEILCEEGYFSEGE